MDLKSLEIAEAYNQMRETSSYQPLNEVTLNRILHKKHFVGSGLCVIDGGPAFPRPFLLHGTSPHVSQWRTFAP